MILTKADKILFLILNNIFIFGSVIVLILFGSSTYHFWAMWLVGIGFLYLALRKEKEPKNKINEEL